MARPSSCEDAPARSILPHPDVAILRANPADPLAARSGYRNVYHAEGTSDRWVARVKLNGRLLKIPGSACRMPHQAALLVVRWYQERYGEKWKDAISRPRRRQALFRVWESAEQGGWLAKVWEFGAATYLTGRRRSRFRQDTFDTHVNCTPPRASWRCPGRLLVFATRESAEAAVRAWINARWGLFAESVLWRI